MRLRSTLIGVGVVSVILGCWLLFDSQASKGAALGPVSTGPISSEHWTRVNVVSTPNGVSLRVNGRFVPLKYSSIDQSLLDAESLLMTEAQAADLANGETVLVTTPYGNETFVLEPEMLRQWDIGIE